LNLLLHEGLKVVDAFLGSVQSFSASVSFLDRIQVQIVLFLELLLQVRDLSLGLDQLLAEAACVSTTS
jgi:hypothetical protein